MDNGDHEFERLRQEFDNQHYSRSRGLAAHMNEAKELLEKDLAAGGIRHTPISARLKDKEKALRTLKRRHEARRELQNLKAMVEARDSETWEQYCKIWNMEDKIHEAEPFTSVSQMFEDMHDLAGIRVSLYFPDDVEKVVDLLRNRFAIVEGPVRKGGLTQDFQKIRKLVEEQRQGQGGVNERRGPLGSLETTKMSPESPFGGYRATHVVIRNTHNFDQHVRGDGKINIEVQIGSIIMHAWSDIEHDILYKPSDTGTASPDVVRMLGLINGIVMTGEVALQQLASIFAAESNRKAEDRSQKAMGPHYMTPWIDKYFMDHETPLPPNPLWMSTGYLFDILKATNEHHYGRLEQLLNEMKPEPINRLPVLVLHHLGRDTYPFKDPFQGSIPSGMKITIVAAWSARYWATRLVHTLNMARYMGVDIFTPMIEHTDEDKSLHNRYPTFAELLDILHPKTIKHRPGHEVHIIEFCKAMLATPFPPQSHSLAAMKLVSAGYVARPRISEDEESLFTNEPPIFVPARVKSMKGDSLRTFRIMLSLIDEGLRSDDDYLCFVPRPTDGSDYTCVWKPVIRQSGRWDIIHAPFNYDTTIAFERDNLNFSVEVDHMRRTLGVDMGADEIRKLRSLERSLNIRGDQLRLIIDLTRVLGTTDKDQIRDFKDLLGSEKVKGDDEIRMLAELKRSKEIKDPDDLKWCLQLSRSVRTTSPEEIRAYRQLARDRGTKDTGKLQELRNEQKDARRASNQEHSRLGDDLADGRGSLSDTRSAISGESSDDDD